MRVICCWGTYLPEYALERGGRKTRSVARTLRRFPKTTLEAGWWCGGTWRHSGKVVSTNVARRWKLPNFRNNGQESITRESRHNLTILENACIFVSWWIIFMIFWKHVQKHADCQCQKHFSPGGTISGIFKMLNNLAKFWINRKANFDMNEDLWVWGIITREKRQEVFKDSNHPVRKSFSPGGPHIRPPTEYFQF